MADFTVQDDAGKYVIEGCRVYCGDPSKPRQAKDHGTVVSISDPDGDFNYDLNRTVAIDPSVKVVFDYEDGSRPGENDGKAETETFPTHSLARGPWDDDSKYICYDVEVIEDGSDSAH